MQRLYIIKVGSTFPATAARFGDFDAWTARALGYPGVGVWVVDAEHGAALPAVTDCAGIVITGSHAMVTDNLPWSLALEDWVRDLLGARIPLFGICYGHQLLARAAGGQVGYHPLGIEIGTVPVQLLAGCETDPLFQGLPGSFAVHATHAQTVLRLPPGATPLASNGHDPHHAFRLGSSAWGVQFHPEYTADLMRAYLDAEAEDVATAGLDLEQLRRAVVETPVAASILRRFGAYVAERLDVAVPCNACR